MKYSNRGCRAFTLVELTVAIAIIGILAVVSVIGMGNPDSSSPSRPEMVAVASARARALAEGRAVTVQLRFGAIQHLVTVLPDGSVIADSALGIQRLTGAGR